MNLPGPTVLPLASAHASMALVGGKALSLAKLAASGLPVPAGFVVTTTAYREFVEAHDLQRSIDKVVAASERPRDASSELGPTDIRSLFEDAWLSKRLAASIGHAYVALGKDHPAVAVRSSATAEDLPGASFAGQQESLLNVRGEPALLIAIRRCWASLWTARAVGYREQMGIGHAAAAMGVIVQVIVPADVSGILFTANPTSGERGELVVNANFGLGESVVGGHVTPDTYVLDRARRELRQTHIGGKSQMTVATGEQGTVTRPVPPARRGESSLSQEELRELAALGVQAEQLFNGLPQDIEWALARGHCWLLQSRPITNLPPPPLQDVSWAPPTQGTKLIRRQVVENMPEPLSPLFEELYLGVGLEQAIDHFMAVFEMDFDFELFMERPMFLTVNGYAYCRGSYRSSWRMLWILPKVIYAYVRVLPRLLKNLIPNWRDHALPAYLETIERWKAVDPATASDDVLLSGVRALTVADANYWFQIAMVIGAAKSTDGLLNWFLTSWCMPGELSSGMFLCGFPSKTLEAQAALEEIAGSIQKVQPLRDMILDTSAGELLGALEKEEGGHATAEDLSQFLRQYGHQVYNLDFVQSTQVEHPLPVLLSLKALVRAEFKDTPARQAEMVRERETLQRETLESLDPIRRWLLRKFLGWAHRFYPYREDALFYMGAGWPTLRRLVLEMGKRLVDVDTLNSAEDAFYLESAELQSACRLRQEGRASPEYAARAEQRRALREARRRLHPPGILPEASRWTFGPFDFSAFETQKHNTNDANVLRGFAVSPGKVTGVASVILSPADFDQMKSDTILVCPTTTPAWTPLFTQALGLVTEMGGILAHGSIVAREFGIPAVMGTGNITQRIVSGQRITVDGDTGTVTIVE